MNSVFSRASCLLFLVLGSFALPSVTVAQPADSQDAAFEQLLADPTNPDAMMRYARAAVANRDYEAVVSTLERLLDLEPSHAEARYELAVAYYALGSYEIAAFHFAALEEAGVAGTRADEVAAYQAQIAERTAVHKVTGRAAIGGAFTEDGAAAALDVRLRWSADLGLANDTTWVTDVLGAIYAGNDDLTSNRLQLRTGPQFALLGDAYGPRLRPYTSLLWSNDDDGDEYASARLGAQYFNSHGTAWSSFADANFGAYNGSGGLSDGELWSARLGVTYRPSRQTRLRALVYRSDRDADDAVDRSKRTGVRLEYRHSFQPPGALRGTGTRNWVGSVYLQRDRIEYTGTGREDDLSSLGLMLRAFVRDDLFTEVSARTVRRDSSLDALDETSPVLSVLVGREF